jgi:hypothetical protein
MTENDSNVADTQSTASSAATTPTTVTTPRTGQDGGNRLNTNRDRRALTIGSDDKDWEGAKPEVGAVLGLKTEKITKKVTFEVFREKLATYVLSEFNNPKDVLPAVKRMTDPMVDFKAKQAPKDLTDDEKKSDVEVQMQQQRIKLYISRETMVRTNMDKLYGIITGQCSQASIAIMENRNDFQKHDDACDVIWLMQTMKEITSGLDDKSNKRANLHDALLAFV